MSAFAIGGGVASALGGALAAQSGNRAARQARDLSRNDAFSQMGRTYDALGYNPAQYQAGNGGTTLQRTKASIFDENGNPLPTGATGGGYLGAMGQLAGSVSQRQQGDLGYEDATTKRLQQLVSQLGRGRGQIIDQDASKALTGANRSSTARLNSMGLGNSTAVTNAMAGNAQRSSREVQRAKQALYDTTSGQQLGLATDRASQRSNLEQQSLNRDISLRADPQERALSILTGGGANPLGGVNNSTPGVSSLGSALVSGGNAVAQYGSQQMNRQNNQQVMDALSRLFGS